MPNAIENMESEIADLEKSIAAQPEPTPEPEPRAESEPERVEQREHGADHAERSAVAPQERNLAQALEESRREQRELKKALEERTREHAVFADRLERLQQVVQQPAPMPEQVEELPAHVKAGKPTVTFEDDPAEYLRQRDDLDDRRNKLVMDYIGSQKRSTEQAAQQAQILQAIQASEYHFVRQQPDYLKAVEFLREDRVADLMETGMPYPQAMQQVLRDQAFIATTALQQRKDPAAVAYAMAVRKGYRPESATAEQTAQPAPPAPAANGGGKPALDLDKIAAGTREAATLSSVGGGSGGGKLTAEALLKMPEAEFEAALAKMSKAQQQELMGA